MLRPTFGPPTPAADAQSADAPPRSAAEERFEVCRWRSPRDVSPPHCTHRDVFPLAGSTGFRAEAWCGECAFYKPRRITRKQY